MPQGAYPISRFVRQIITDSGLRRSEFVQAIGYKNVAKGLRRLDEWLQNGSGDEGCLQKIIDAFHPDPTALEHALVETERIHQREHDEAVREIEDRERRRSSTGFASTTRKLVGNISGLAKSSDTVTLPTSTTASCWTFTATSSNRTAAGFCCRKSGWNFTEAKPAWPESQTGFFAKGNPSRNATPPGRRPDCRGLAQAGVPDRPLSTRRRYFTNVPQHRRRIPGRSDAGQAVGGRGHLHEPHQSPRLGQ